MSVIRVETHWDVKLSADDHDDDDQKAEVRRRSSGCVRSFFQSTAVIAVGTNFSSVHTQRTLSCDSSVSRQWWCWRWSYLQWEGVELSKHCLLFTITHFYSQATDWVSGNLSSSAGPNFPTAVTPTPPTPHSDQVLLASVHWPIFVSEKIILELKYSYLPLFCFVFVE